MLQKTRKKRSFLEKLVEDALVDFLMALLFMLLLGITHGLDPRVPTLGYWTCFLLLWVLGIPVTVAIHAYKRWNT